MWCAACARHGGGLIGFGRRKAIAPSASPICDCGLRAFTSPKFRLISKLVPSHFCYLPVLDFLFVLTNRYLDSSPAYSQLHPQIGFLSQSTRFITKLVPSHFYYLPVLT